MEKHNRAAPIAAIYWRYFPFMRKKTLVILFILEMMLSFLAFLALIPTIALIQCINGVCTSLPGPAILRLVLGSLLILAGSVLHIIVWIGMLMKQAKQQQWTWFICTFLLGRICILIYLIKIPETPQSVLSAYAPGYQQASQYQSYSPMMQSPPQEQVPLQPSQEE
jgi:hypothetical protein